MAKRQSTKKSRSGGSPKKGNSDYSSFLITAFLLIMAAGAFWYLWPRPDRVMTEHDTQRELKKLTHQSPDAEVFDLGDQEKKK